MNALNPTADEIETDEAAHGSPPSSSPCSLSCVFGFQE